METIATRIIKLCDVLHISKSDFARRINVTPSYISKLSKSPESVPSDRTIADICREFHVSELWIRTGQGDMFVQRSLNEELTAMVNEIMNDTDESFRKRFVAALLQVPPDGWGVIEKMVNNLAESEKKEKEKQQ